MFSRSPSPSENCCSGTVNPGADAGSDTGTNGGSTESPAQGCNAGAAAGPIAALAGLALMTLRRRRRARK